MAWVGLLLVVGLVAEPTPTVSAAGRVALVVGNSTYAHIVRLPNPENDAADMAAALGRLGFDVTTVRDADRVAMNEALRAFTRESAGADLALVFYAGHGLEMDGVNYLVPVDAQSGAGHRRAVRSGDAGRRAGGHRGSGVAGGDSGCLPEQPAGAVDAADGSEPEREWGQLRGPERRPAGGRDAGGVCGWRRGRRRPTGGPGTARTRRRSWRTWSNRSRSAFCSAGSVRRCRHRRTVSSVRTNTSHWWASTTSAGERRWRWRPWRLSRSSLLPWPTRWW